MTFSDEIAKWAKAAGQDIDKSVRAVQLQAVELVVEKTPVDTGQARGGWYATIGAPSTTVGGTADKEGESTIARATPAASTTGDVFYFVNNLPYIRALEFGEYGDGPKTAGGYSTQAPRGMVRVSVLEIRAAIRRTIRNAVS